jgi:hypothetical protein
MTVGVAGARNLTRHSAPMRLMRSIVTRVVSIRAATDCGRAPEMRRRSVSGVPVGTAPRGRRYAELKESWKSVTRASAAGAKKSAAAASAM